jgi:hypothetical protein
MSNARIRLATPAELAQFEQLCCYEWSCDPECLPERTLIVHENFISDGPGYCGEVFVALWAGGPSCITVATRLQSGALFICHNHGS